MTSLTSIVVNSTHRFLGLNFLGFFFVIFHLHRDQLFLGLLGGWDMVVARIVGCDWWLTSCFFLFSLSNTWICVVDGVEVGGFVPICWWCGGSVEWGWVGFCQFVGGCLGLLGCEIWRLKFHFTGFEFNFLDFKFAGFVFLA